MIYAHGFAPMRPSSLPNVTSVWNQIKQAGAKWLDIDAHLHPDFAQATTLHVPESKFLPARRLNNRC